MHLRYCVYAFVVCLCLRLRDCACTCACLFVCVCAYVCACLSMSVCLCMCVCVTPMHDAHDAKRILQHPERLALLPACANQIMAVVTNAIEVQLDHGISYKCHRGPIRSR